jgi:hypothetical protein
MGSQHVVGFTHDVYVFGWMFGAAAVSANMVTPKCLLEIESDRGSLQWEHVPKSHGEEEGGM